MKTENNLGGVDIFDTLTLVTTNKGYRGRGSQSEADSSDGDTDPLLIALENANALSPKTGKVKRGVTAWVSIVVVITGDKFTSEDIESDHFDNNICRGSIPLIGSTVTAFTLKG